MITDFPYELTSQDDLDAAIRAEHDAYALMRDLVPELELPLAQRPPLTRRQQAAVDAYRQARKRLRGAHEFVSGRG